MVAKALTPKTLRTGRVTLISPAQVLGKYQIKNFELLGILGIYLAKGGSALFLSAFMARTYTVYVLDFYWQ